MTGLIPQPFITELLARTDLIELIDGYVPLKKRGNSYIACCPFHQEKTPSFNVVAKKQFYHCFGCGANGNAISFVMGYLNQSFLDAIETLASRAGMPVPREKNAVKTQQALSLYELLSQVSRYYQNSLKSAGEQAIQYLKKRGLSGEIAQRYQLGYAASGWNTLENHFRQYREDLITSGMLIQKDDGKTYDRYRHRVMFPIHDRNGRIIGFGGRALDDDQKPKYLNSPETIIFQKNRELYGLHQVLQSKETLDHILIVEGYMDVIALAQHGIINAVATLGTATSTYHIQLLAKHTQHLIFCFDGDNAGRQAAWRALENTLPQLNTGMTASFIFLPDQHDPDSLVREEGSEPFKARLKQAMPINQFFFDTLSRDIDRRSVAGKSQLINAVRPYLQTIPEGPFRQLILEELSRHTHIDQHRLDLMIQDKSTNQAPLVSQTITRSPLRLALALLIQNPAIYFEINPPEKISAFTGEGGALLNQLIDQINKTAGANTATLLECWRDTPHFDSLCKLAAWDHQVPDEAQKRELLDILDFLQKQHIQETKIDQYLAKSRREGLTAEERLELQNMLKQKHQRDEVKT